jgi:undecaprenyl-diphosphatase
VKHIARRLLSVEPTVLALLALCTAALWGFIEIAEEVIGGDAEALDHWIVQSMRDRNNSADPIGPQWVEEMARDASALGGLAWVTSATIIIAVYLWIDGKSHMTILLATATTSGAIVSLLLKSAFARPRPDLEVPPSNESIS